MAFTLTFAAGGKATVAVKDLDEERMTLDVAFDRAIQGRPFAVLRSMYVTEFNADVRALPRAREGPGLARGADHELRQGQGHGCLDGPAVPSRHNTSAPDMMFNRFRAALGLRELTARAISAMRPAVDQDEAHTDEGHPGHVPEAQVSSSTSTPSRMALTGTRNVTRTTFVAPARASRRKKIR